MTFTFSIGGYFNDYKYEVNLKEENLVVSKFQYFRVPEEDSLIPVFGNPHWENLINFLKQCNWLKTYDSGACDGTQWGLKARGKGFNLNCYGSNEYPTEFVTFINLLNQVISSSGIQIQDDPTAYFDLE